MEIVGYGVNVQMGKLGLFWLILDYMLELLWLTLPFFRVLIVNPVIDVCNGRTFPRNELNINLNHIKARPRDDSLQIRFEPSSTPIRASYADCNRKQIMAIYSFAEK